jgi:NAD(P)-dependent dehydrogenase (short-subunit alcohol dehydrogenase family)
MRFAGKVAVITGGNSGIGLAAARRFVQEGARVFLSGRRAAELRAAVDELGSAATAIACDVTKVLEVEAFYEEVRRQVDHVDVVFANAGVGGLVPLAEITESHMDWIFGVNLKGTVFTVQKGLPLLRDGGTIVLNASMVSILASPAFSVYAASKAALRSFVRSWMVELQDRRIRVNAVSPGVTPTPGYANLGLTGAALDAYVASQTALIPLGRVATPDEIAKAVLFLASDESSYVNGVELFVDGGQAQV